MLLPLVSTKVLNHFSNSIDSLAPVDPGSELVELATLGAVLGAVLAADAPEAFEETVLVSDAAEPADEPVVEALSESLEDVSLDMWGYARLAVAECGQVFVYGRE